MGSAVFDFRSISDRVNRVTTHPITRITSIKGDPGFEEWNNAIATGHRIDIYLDGMRQCYCTAADVRGGWVVRAKLDASGQPYCEDKVVVQERVFGVVEIKIVDCR